MSRSSNLDNVAPDDPIFSDKKSKVTEEVEIPKSNINTSAFNFSEHIDGEKILMVIRPHWFTLTKPIFTSIIMFLVPMFFSFFPFNIFPNNSFAFVSVYFWYLATFAYTLENFISWYYNNFIITSERIVDIDVHNLIDRKFTEAQISAIQDITYTNSGVSQALFGYGSVKIETAGESPDIKFEKIPHPEKIVKLLQNLCHNKHVSL